MKKIIFTLILILIVPCSARADIYEDQIAESGLESIENTLPQSAEDFLNQNDISIYDSDWINKIKSGNVFLFLIDTLKTEGKMPLITGSCILGLILLLSVAQLFSNKSENEQTLCFLGTCVCAGAVLLPVFSVITAALRTLKGGAQFMLSFTPIYCTVLIASGKPLTASSSGAVLLAASQAVVWLTSNFITPILSAYLAVCMCGNISPAINVGNLGEFLKKFASWSLGLIMTVYIGILSLQSTVNAAADSLALKTGKFMIGSFVPVVGGAVSEALSTVQASIDILRSSAGIYGVVVLVLIILPSIIQLLLWRAVLLLSSTVAAMFSVDKIGALLRAADSAISLIIGIVLICSVAFIFSLTVVTKAGG